MARRCFKVSSLKFRFNRYQTTTREKSIFVCEGLNTYLKKYASNTKLKKHYIQVEEGDIVVFAELSKKISLNTVINIIDQMYAKTGEELSIGYLELREIVTVSILR